MGPIGKRSSPWSSWSWDIFSLSVAIAEQNLTKLDQQQVNSTPSTKFVVFGKRGLSFEPLVVWVMIDFYSATAQLIRRNLIESKCSTSSTKFAFSGWPVIKDCLPGLLLAVTCSTFPPFSQPLYGIALNLSENHTYCPLQCFCPLFFGGGVTSSKMAGRILMHVTLNTSSAFKFLVIHVRRQFICAYFYGCLIYWLQYDDCYFHIRSHKLNKI